MNSKTKQLVSVVLALALGLVSGLYFGMQMGGASSEASQAALQQNYDIGYQDGLKDGKDAGYDEGLAEGIKTGFEQGYDQGFDEGYAGGTQDAKTPSESASESSAETDPEKLLAKYKASDYKTPEGLTVTEDGWYYSKEEVGLYIHTFGKLPENFLSKKQAKALGWSSGSLEKYAPGKVIGGSQFGNNEGLLPKAKGRTYTECDIDTKGAKSRGAKRIVFSNDGLVFYTGDHYESFELLYGKELL